MKTYIDCFWISIFIAVGLFVSLPAQQTENVIVAVVDGARFTETIGDSTHQNIPFMWNLLRPQALTCDSVYIDGVTKTLSGHAAILSGCWQRLANDGTESPHCPTLFEYYRASTGVDSTEAWLVLGKEKLQIVAHSDAAGYGAEYGASVRFSEHQYDDSEALQSVLDVMAEYQPHLLMVNFGQTDYMGHCLVWERYVNAIAQSDSLIYLLWQAIQNNDHYRDKTTLIITNDHGRHLEEWTEHGDDCEGCAHVMMMVLGPEVIPGSRHMERISQIDIAPTVGWLMGFDTPYAEGASLESLFVPPSAVWPAKSTAPVLALSPCYPNPFCQDVSVDVQLLQAQYIDLAVFDAMGRRMETLFTGRLQAGTHHFTQSADHWARGTYFFALHVAGKVVTQKAVAF